MDSFRRNLLLGVPALAAAAMLAQAGSAAAAPGGGKQSPIDIRRRDAVDSPDLPELVFDYPQDVDVRVHYVSGEPKACDTRGPEDVVEAEVPEGTAAVQLGEVRYELLQFHFHTRSEHLLDGRGFPLEQHFVHRGPDGETLVVGLFLVPGGNGHTLQDAVMRQLPEECGPERKASGDLSAALPRDLSTFRYDGSLTTSPYSEPVSWLVLERPFAITASSVKRYRELFPEGNNRDAQPLNGREVRFRPQR
jgi:carbonic anhydrase